MRLAVVSDIHSNWDAFKAVLRDISGQGVHAVVSLGDNIGYGGQPEEVLVNLKRYKIPSVLGNHEQALLDEHYLALFNPHARKALEINREKLSAAAKNYISGFTPCLVRHGCRFVHGVPPDTVARYLFNESDARLISVMSRLREPISFVGHTHEIAVYELYNGVLNKKNHVKMTVSLAKRRRYIINTGSVGQPRDGYNKAKYVIWDNVRQTIEPRFVPYDFRKAMDKIREAGIPERYAVLLEKAVI